VLILSEMAGSASELGEAVSVNPQDRNGMAEAIRDALEMPELEQRGRLEAMQERLKRYTVSRWARDFLEGLDAAASRQRSLAVRKLTADVREQMLKEYGSARRRLLLLDYDGTLVGFVADPDRARPDKELRELLERLGGDERNEVVVVSGRNREKLGAWLKGYPVGLVAEHGAYICRRGEQWQMIEAFSNAWKESIRPIFERFCDRTPGSSIEEKDYALVWHYRRAAPELAYVRRQELRDAVLDLTVNLDLGAFEGNKILEVKNIGINKGRAAESWLGRGKWDFVLGIGDDYTDEDMFAMLAEPAWTVKVGPGISQARFNVDTVRDVRELLEELAGRRGA
jgi:trehalose 6-phosphate synthase/phosphatase